MNFKFTIIFAVILVIHFAFGHPEKGKWIFETSPPFPKTIIVTKSMYKGGTIDVKISCNSDRNITVNWILWKTPCWKHHFELSPVHYKVSNILKELEEIQPNLNETDNPSVIKDKFKIQCNKQGTYLEYLKKTEHVSDGSSADDLGNDSSAAVMKDSTALGTPSAISPINLSIMPADGIYMFLLEVTNNLQQSQNYTVTIKINMKNSHGYLSAADYPLLPFYSIMCIVYFGFGVGWLAVSFMRWRELLRVQYWIGAVILLGMLEKAVFTGVYESVNERGDFIPSLLYVAEIVSCVKRTLSRILVIIVAFGFGIVKPRLGSVLHRMVALGLLYFILATIESCLRVTKVDNLNTARNHSRVFDLAIVPLALLETVICWWVFSALSNTIRTLSLRRNTIKLQLYKHFKNTLAFSVIISIIFMTYCIFNQNLNLCVEDWKQLWVNTAFWHVLFAFILLVIMILWRPTNNNQRFAFSPLLDEASEDEEEKLVSADVSDTMKLRSTRNNSTSNSQDSRSLEDDLQWLDENIPKTMIDKGFPSVDSDEEVIVTKFEISKMQ